MQGLNDKYNNGGTSQVSKKVKSSKVDNDDVIVKRNSSEAEAKTHHT